MSRRISCLKCLIRNYFLIGNRGTLVRKGKHGQEHYPLQSQRNLILQRIMFCQRFMFNGLTQHQSYTTSTARTGNFFGNVLGFVNRDRLILLSLGELNSNFLSMRFQFIKLGHNCHAKQSNLQSSFTELCCSIIFRIDIMFENSQTGGMVHIQSLGNRGTNPKTTCCLKKVSLFVQK